MPSERAALDGPETPVKKNECQFLIDGNYKVKHV